jgi:mono/diheme cytochrome c family protein
MALATFAVACGRASETDINAALGITPSPTMSADDMATSTAQASENATRVAGGGSGVDTAGEDTTNLAVLGNPLIGRTSFLSNCTGCHVANGSGVAAPVPGASGMAALLTDMQIYNVIREGTGHGTDIGGPGARANLTDKQIYDMIAFIRNQP